MVISLSSFTGGGPAIKNNLDKLHIPSAFQNGLRVTPLEVLEVVEMTLAGSVNQALTRAVNKAGLQAIGLCGSDAGLLQAEALDFECYGYVGHVTGINKQLLEKITSVGIIPVIASVAIGKDNARYNINADTAAAAIAAELQAKQLVFVTDVPGILHDERLLETVTEEQAKTFIETGVVHGGMVPKVKAALDSLTDNLQEVMIVDGKQLTKSKDDFFCWDNHT
ncbi:acetylglutamate kinase [Virgibacillus halophilus]|uniref:acetylglutamate kinase n=1 Tax=Tigheibacillus halophilus TaxID=361280 RepID=A0ABU5CAA9_9BACI|nr:acetylglutamate kinase [Virgibacillus halophilus]